MNPSFATFHLAITCAVRVSTRQIGYHSLDRAHLLDHGDMAISLTDAGWMAYTNSLNYAIWIPNRPLASSPKMPRFVLDYFGLYGRSLTA